MAGAGVFKSFWFYFLKEKGYESLTAGVHASGTIVWARSTVLWTGEGTEAGPPYTARTWF